MEPDSMVLPPASTAQPLPPQSSLNKSGRASPRLSGTEYTVPRPYSTSRAPNYVRNATSPDNPTVVSDDNSSAAGSKGLIGPVGYDSE